MLSVGVVLLIATLAFTARRGGTALGAQTIPLTATVVDVRPASQRMLMRLTNTGDKAILAWAIEITVKSKNGKSLTYRREDDGFLAADMRTKTMLEPGQPREVIELLPAGLEPASVTASVVAAIFEDATAAGDPARVAFIMNRRATERDDLDRWIANYKTAIVKHAGGVHRADGKALGQLTAVERREMRAEEFTRLTPSAERVAALDEFEKSLAPETEGSRVALSLHTTIKRLRKAPKDSFEQNVATFARVLDLQYANAVKHARSDK
jgi:hypothetical protein